MSAVRTFLPLEPLAHPLEAVSAAPSEALTADAALARLKAAGLVCDQAKGPRLHILGGLRVVVSRGIRVYEDAFAIFSEPEGGYMAMVSGLGKHPDEEVPSETLTIAVDAVLAVYRRRDALKPALR